MSDRFANLALHDYKLNINNEVLNELQLANIPVLELPGYMNTEVKTNYIGLLNGFMFYRAWRYWICYGDMPLEEARYIYDNYKELSIRAGGHCGNLSPESQSYNPVYMKNLSELFDSIGKRDLMECIEASRLIIDDKNLPRFVGCYHIDTQLGLCKLVQTIREHKIKCNPYILSK